MVAEKWRQLWNSGAAEESTLHTQGKAVNKENRKEQAEKHLPDTVNPLTILQLAFSFQSALCCGDRTPGAIWFTKVRHFSQSGG